LTNEGEEARKASPPAQESQEPMVGRENLEKIRELLFGSQAKTFESKMVRMDERLLREIGDVRNEVRNRLDSLEMYVKNELQTVIGRITSEHEQRSEAFRQMTVNLRDTAEAFEKKTAQLDNKLEEKTKELREQLLFQAKRLTDDTLKKHEEAVQAMEESATRIRSEYVDRSNLSKLFTELAVRLDAAFAGELLAAPEERENE
jgi:hypothetical protein